MKKILFAITDLEIGGAERVFVDTVNRIRNDYNITILTIYAKGKLEKELHPDILIKSISKKSRKKTSLFKRKLIALFIKQKFLRKAFYYFYVKRFKYDTEVAFLEGPVTVLLSGKNDNTKKLAWVHTDMSKHFKNSSKYKKYYDKYEKIVFCSNDALSGFKKVIETDTKKQVIYNFIDIKKIVSKAREFEAKEIDPYIPSFVVVARLIKAKALDRLIEVSKRLNDDKLLHKIYIIGDGSEKKNLEKLINKYKLKNCVYLLGYKTNPYPYINKANYFLLPSKYEGFGMVLIEAMMLSKTIISTDTAAKEALEGYGHKTITENSEEGLYNGISAVLKKQIKWDDKIDIKYNSEKVIEKLKKIL